MTTFSYIPPINTFISYNMYSYIIHLYDTLFIMYDTTLFVFNELISEYTTELIDGNITMQIILLLGLYSFVMLFITIRLFLDNQHLDVKINSLRAEVNFLKKAERKLEEERSVWLNIIKNTNNSVKSVEKKVKKIEKEFTLYM